MKIVDLDSHEKLAEAASRLQSEILSDNRDWDLIVAIPRGGQITVECMKGLTKDRKVVLIKKQREGTKKKEKSAFFKLLPFFPKLLKNLLRNIESYFLERQFKRSDKSQSGLIDINEDIKNKIACSKCIIIIDDAVDSGGTMNSVLVTVNHYAEDKADVKTACINTTFKSSLCQPDFVLYPHTIIRYPWALDVKKKQSS